MLIDRNVSAVAMMPFPVNGLLLMVSHSGLLVVVVMPTWVQSVTPTRGQLIPGEIHHKHHSVVGDGLQAVQTFAGLPVEKLFF